MRWQSHPRRKKGDSHLLCEAPFGPFPAKGDCHLFCGRRRRRGAVLVAALVCLLIVMAMLGSMLQGALRARRQLHRERDLRQTELLLRAGVERAAFRVAGEPGYPGETWTLPADEIVGSGEGQVNIEVSPPSDANTSQVRVVAEYPVGNETSIRRSHTFTVPNQIPQNPE